MNQVPQTDSLEKAHEALRDERWELAAEFARLALKQAELTKQESGAALAHFILGTALAAPVDATFAVRAEAEQHLGAALPHFLEAGEHDLAGEAQCLLGGLAVVRARERGDMGCMQSAADHYREAIGCFVRGEDLESRCTALHRARIHATGYCLSSRGNVRTAASVSGLAHCRSSRHTRTGWAAARCSRCVSI